MARGARAAIKANVRASTVGRVRKPRTNRVTTQDANLRLMVGAKTGFDATAHGVLGTRVG